MCRVLGLYKTKMNTLVTGHSGYLCGSLMKHIPGNIIKYTGDVRSYKQYSDIDTVIHFAGPSDTFDFSDRKKTVTTIVDGTINLLKIAKLNSAKFVFASTMGVYHTATDDLYGSCKLAMEQYIKNTHNDYIILRIPRVYSKCRSKGLMKKIRRNMIPLHDHNKIIEYITLQEFIDQTKNILYKQNIIHEYNITNSKTIGELIEWVKE